MTLQELDRTIFELLRDGAVESGLLPDIEQYTTSKDYNEAKETLIQSKKRLIEVYGVGAGERRDEIITNRITIDRVNIADGDLGAYGVVFYEKQTDKTYNKYLMPSSTMDIDYDIRIITNSVKYERICQDIILKKLGTKKYISTIDTDCNYLLLRDGMFNLSGNKLLEYSFRYKVKDVFLEEHTLLDDKIPEVKSVDSDIKIYE